MTSSTPKVRLVPYRGTECWVGWIAEGSYRRGAAGKDRNAELGGATEAGEGHSEEGGKGVGQG